MAKGVKARKAGRPTYAYLSKENLTKEIDRLAEEIKEQQLVLDKLRKERERYVTHLVGHYYGLVVGQVYDLQLNGRIAKGKFQAVERQRGHKLSVQYVLRCRVQYRPGGREVIRTVLPHQVIGLQGLDLDALALMFQSM